MSLRKITGNRLFVLCIVVLLVAFTIQLPGIPMEGRIYPMTLIIASFLFCIYLLASKQKKEQSTDKSVLFACCVLVLMIAAYIFLLGKIGYILATLVFLYGALWFLKVRNIKLLVIYPAVLTLLMYFLFNRILSVLLPAGCWFSLNL